MSITHKIILYDDVDYLWEDLITQCKDLEKDKLKQLTENEQFLQLKQMKTIIIIL